MPVSSSGCAKTPIMSVLSKAAPCLDETGAASPKADNAVEEASSSVRNMEWRMGLFSHRCFSVSIPSRDERQRNCREKRADPSAFQGRKLMLQQDVRSGKVPKAHRRTDL